MSVLIKDMEIPESCAKCTFGDGYSCYAKGYIVQEDDWENKRADFCPLIEIPDKDVQPVKWIPVTERLPEGKEGNYLVAAKTPRGIEVHEAVYFKPFDDYEWLDPVEEYQSYNVTHWMPLPEPPKDGEV